MLSLHVALFMLDPSLCLSQPCGRCAATLNNNKTPCNYPPIAITSSGVGARSKNMSNMVLGQAPAASLVYTSICKESKQAHIA